MFSLLIAIIVLIGVVYFFNTQIGKKVKARLRGTAETVLEKDASTVEGATAYYNTAIEKAAKNYTNSNNEYVMIVGKIESFSKELRNLQKEDAELVQKIEQCIDKKDDNSAKHFLEKQQEIEEKMQILKESIKELKKTEELKKEENRELKDKYHQLKKEKETQIFKLQTAQTTASLKKTAASSIANSAEDRMLEKVRDNVKKAQEEALGAQIAYENSSRVQEKRLTEKLKQDDLDKKLEALKSKRSK